jgi:hypothetical protein
MRPFFHKKTQPTQDKRAEKYRRGQRELERVAQFSRGRTVALAILGLFGGFMGANREVAAWMRTANTGLPIWIVKAARAKSIEAAEAKRARKRARNIMWWMNDSGWQRECQR